MQVPQFEEFLHDEQSQKTQLAIQLSIAPLSVNPDRYALQIVVQ